MHTYEQRLIRPVVSIKYTITSRKCNDIFLFQQVVTPTLDTVSMLISAVRLLPCFPRIHVDYTIYSTAPL